MPMVHVGSGGIDRSGTLPTICPKAIAVLCKQRPHRLRLRSFFAPSCVSALQLFPRVSQPRHAALTPEAATACGGKNCPADLLRH
jgi:hypothetical protein